MRFILLLGSFCLLVAPGAFATPVSFGTPVSGLGGGAVVGTVDATTHAITFFIPFTDGHAGSCGAGAARPIIESADDSARAPNQGQSP